MQNRDLTGLTIEEVNKKKRYKLRDIGTNGELCLSCCIGILRNIW